MYHRFPGEFSKSVHPAEQYKISFFPRTCKYTFSVFFLPTSRPLSSRQQFSTVLPVKVYVEISEYGNRNAHQTMIKITHLQDTRVMPTAGTCGFGIDRHQTGSSSRLLHIDHVHVGIIMSYLSVIEHSWLSTHLAKQGLAVPATGCIDKMPTSS